METVRAPPLCQTRAQAAPPRSVKPEHGQKKQWARPTPQNKQL